MNNAIARGEKWRSRSRRTAPASNITFPRLITIIKSNKFSRFALSPTLDTERSHAGCETRDAQECKSKEKFKAMEKNRFFFVSRAHVSRIARPQRRKIIGFEIIFYSEADIDSCLSIDVAS